MKINLKNVVKIMFDDFLEVEAKEGHEDKLEEASQELKSTVLEDIKENYSEERIEEFLAFIIAHDLEELSRSVDEKGKFEEGLNDDQ